MLLKLYYAKFYVSRLFRSKVIEEKPLGGRLDPPPPLGKGRVKRDDKQYIEKLNYKGVTFPVSQKHNNKIEKQNSIKINVLGYEEKNYTRFTFLKRRSKTK